MTVLARGVIYRFPHTTFISPFVGSTGIEQDSPLFVGLDAMGENPVSPVFPRLVAQS